MSEWKRKRTVCPCSTESECITDAQRRSFGWRLVPASADPESSRAAGADLVDVFVWVCPPCASLRTAQLTRAAG